MKKRRNMAEGSSNLAGAVDKANPIVRKGKKGRHPMPFSQTIADSLCEQIALGKSLRSICRDDDTMPSIPTIFKWLAEVPSFTEQYARARQAQADAMVDDMIDIADDETLDPNDRRIRIDARKWIAGKMRPKKYGDKTLIGSDPDNPLPEQTVKIDVAAIATQLRKQKALSAIIDSETNK